MINEYRIATNIIIDFNENPFIIVFLCTQKLKNRVHSRIGQCVRPSVRLHDNF